VVIGSTRPGRVGLSVGRWFVDRAEGHERFDLEVTDLAELGLPLLDEPHHPRLRRYEHDHTKEWSARVDRADAVVFVTPEYNHGPPASVKNALDFLHQEWRDKPVGFVSYGGVAGGTRAVQQLKQVVVALRMVPVFESVTIPLVADVVDAEGRVAASQAMDGAADAMLQELLRVAVPLREVRSRALA
jgi:NAD(P)H-dependent FMN reductase